MHAKKKNFIKENKWVRGRVKTTRKNITKPNDL